MWFYNKKKILFHLNFPKKFLETCLTLVFSVIKVVVKEAGLYNCEIFYICCSYNIYNHKKNCRTHFFQFLISKYLISVSV